MSQVNPNNPPLKDKPSGAVIQHSKSKEEKRKRHLAKKERREAQVAEKREQMKAETFAFFAIGVLNGHITGDSFTATETVNDDAAAPTTTEEAGPTETSEEVPDADKTADDNTAGEEPVPETAAEVTEWPDLRTGETVTVPLADGALPPVMSKKERKRQTRIAAENAAKAATLPDLPAEPKKLNDGDSWKERTRIAAEAREAAKALQAKAAQEQVDALAAEQATRNGDAPTEEVSLDLPDDAADRFPGLATIVAADEPKIATLNGESFDAKRISDAPELEATEQAEEANVEVAEEQPTEAQPVEEPAETPPVETAAPAESTGPTLAVDNTEKISNERAELVMAASKFYGSSFNAVNASTLTDAYRFLMMAIRNEAAGKESNVRMSLKKALELEESVFSAVPMKKAA